MLPLIAPLAVVVRILGPAAVRKFSAIHKNLVKANKTKKSRERYLTDKAYDKQYKNNQLDLINGRYYKKGKTKSDADEADIPDAYFYRRKRQPDALPKAKDSSKMTTSPKKKDTSTIVPVFDKATRKYKNFDVSKITEKELYSIKPRSSQLISKWVQYHKGAPSKGIPPLKDATKQAVKKLKEKMKNK